MAKSPPMFSLSYAAEKFGNAVSCLVGSGPHQKRLYSAYQSFHVLRPDDFDSYSELKERYEDILRRLTVVRDQPAELGYVPATLDKMDDQEAADLAQKVFEMYVLIEAVRADGSK